MDSKRRIAIVGPFPPIRGGIARHTGSIARALSTRDDVSVRLWGFYRQYPRMLYPGAGERDPDSSAHVEHVDETLGGTNPLSWHRTAQRIKTWSPTTLVIPAWTFFLAPALGWVARQNPQADRCMVVHNAFDHESAGWKDRICRFQLAQADRFVTHNHALKHELESRLPGKHADVFPHPVFDDFPAAKGTFPKRAKIELLFFGIVRPYKGLDILLEALALADSVDVKLTVAGEFWGDLAQTQDLIKRLGLTEKVELIPRFVSDTEAAELFHRADAVVLPYRSVTGSGVVSNAYHYGRAVIASDLPGLAEVVQNGKTGWLFQPGDPRDLARVIGSLAPSSLKTMGKAAAAFGASLSWSRLADLIVGESGGPSL